MAMGLFIDDRGDLSASQTGDECRPFGSRSVVILSIEEAATSRYLSARK